MDQENKAFQDLMKSLGLSELPEDKQNELVIKMTEVILKRMFVETMDRLSSADQNAYSALLDRGAGAEEIEEFLKGKIENYDQVAEKIIASFMQEMTENKVKTE